MLFTQQSFNKQGSVSPQSTSWFLSSFALSVLLAWLFCCLCACAMQAWRSENDFQESIFSFIMWVQETTLRPSGCGQVLGNLTGSVCSLSTWSQFWCHLWYMIQLLLSSALYPLFSLLPHWIFFFWGGETRFLCVVLVAENTFQCVPWRLPLAL